MFCGLEYYAGNNPVKYVDPDGEAVVLGAIVGKALIGGAISAGVNWGFQIGSNLLAGKQGADIFFDVNAGEIAGAFVSGAITGGLASGVTNASASLFNTVGKKAVQVMGSAAVGAIAAVPATIVENAVNNTLSTNEDVSLTEGMGSNVVVGAIGGGISGSVSATPKYRTDAPDYIKFRMDGYKNPSTYREIGDSIYEAARDEATINVLECVEGKMHE